MLQLLSLFPGDEEYLDPLCTEQTDDMNEDESLTRNEESVSKMEKR